MTFTANHDCSAQSQHFNGPDAEYKQPIRVTKQPVRCSKSEMDLLTVATEFQRAIRAVEESSAVLVLKRMFENTALPQIARVAYHVTQQIDNSELASELNRVQHFSQSVADELRCITNDYRH